MKKILTLLLLFSASVSAKAQTWQPYSQISQHWPNNDIKSYNGKLYVASNDGLFSSADNGATWTDLTAGVSGLGDLVELQFTNNGEIFVRQNSFGIIRSLDGGSTWQLDTLGTGGSYGAALLFYDSVSNRVFFGVGYNKYALYYQAPTDAGWTKVNNLPSTLNNFSPVQMTRKGGKLFVIDVYRRVLESSDNGDTWIQKSGTGLVTAESQVGPSRFLSIGNDLYYGIGGVWKSTDDGDNWTQIDQGFASSDTRCLYHDGATLYSSTFGGGKTYKSVDNGTTWTDMGGSGSWFFKAMTMHNGSLYGVVHSKDSIYVYGSGTASVAGQSPIGKISVYPNPATDVVNIDNVPVGSTISIIDMTGKAVYRSGVTDRQTTISTIEFANGIYMLQIVNNGEFFSRKLMVNK